MKKIILSVGILMIAGIAMGLLFNMNIENKSGVLLANIEALASNPENVTKCPDPYDVPNHYIVSETQSITATSDSHGNLEINGIVSSGFDKNKEYAFIIETKNCSGEAEGACCRQSDVGSSIIM